MYLQEMWWTDARTDRRIDGRWTNFGTKLIYLFFTKENSEYNKGKVFKSNMSKNTVDGNCMTKKMLKVMLSTNPAIVVENYSTNE